MANASPHRSAPNAGHSIDPAGNGQNADAKSSDATSAAASYARPTDLPPAQWSTTSCRSPKAEPTTSATSNCFARHATTQRRDAKPEPEPNAIGYERRGLCALECAHNRNETNRGKGVKIAGKPRPKDRRRKSAPNMYGFPRFHEIAKTPGIPSQTTKIEGKHYAQKAR